MSAAETDLFPEDLLEDALAPERADADRFEAEVARRIAEREPAGDPAEPVTRPWPTWLKRAAAILPPGVIDLALLGKFGSATGGASKAAPGLMWIAAPWAILLVVAASLVGAMRLTSSLDAKNSGRYDDAKRRKVIRRNMSAALFSLIVFMLPMGLLAIALLRGHWHLAGGVFLVTAATIAAFVLTLSRAGFADRVTVATIANAALGQFVGIALMLPIFLRELAGPLTLFALPSVLILGMLGTGLMSDGRSSRRTKIVGPFMLIAAALMPVLTRFTIEAPFGDRVAELEDWVEGFDHPVDGLFEWNALGLARDALGEEIFDVLDRESARQVLAGSPPDARLHPLTALGAWRAGLLSAEQLTDYRRADLLIDNAVEHGEPESHLRDSDLLEVLALIGTGQMTPDRAAYFRAAVEGSLPEPGERSSVQQARVAVDMAAALGIADFVPRHREHLRTVIAGAYSVDGTSYALPGGFGNWLAARDDAGEPHIHPDTTDAFFAVDLMTRVGVPEPVDLAAVDAFLSDQMLSGLSGPLISDVEAALGRHLLRRNFDIPVPTLTDRLESESIFLAALVMVALCLWLVWRAPRARPRIESSPGPDPAGVEA